MNKLHSSIAFGVLLIAGAANISQAATLLPNTTYNVSILADGVSCFTFGNCTTAVPGSNSYLSDNDNDAGVGAGSANPTFGSAIVGDGVAGKMVIQTASDGLGGVTFTVTSFNMDTYIGTAGGMFATQSGASANGDSPTTMTGSVDAAGNIQLDTTGRMGMMTFFNVSLGMQAWNPGVVHTSGSMTGGAGTISGTALDNSGYGKVVASAGVNGWGFFNGTPYTEVFSMQFAPVPVPAAVWLFGSGLLGLMGIAKRKNKA
jgi:hypothetical protein